MKKLLFFTAIAVSIASQATVTKVIGTNCTSKKVEVAGSGIVFNEKDSQYLITSDHVAPADSRLCYTSSTSSIDAAKMTLVSSDWETGLALFKMEKPRSGEKTTLDNFVAPRVRNGDVLQASGFASAEYNEVADRARVISAMSDRTAFLATGPNIEVTGLTTETGLSGGKLSDADSEYIMGILSHKRLVYVPGKASDVVLAQNTAGKDSRVLSTIAIPGDRVKRWADQTINQEARPNYSRDKSNTVKGLGLEFQEKERPNPNDRRSNSQRMKDEMDLMKEIKGGGDGVGIGGSPTGTPILLEISLKSLAQLQSANPNLPEVRWIKEIVSKMVGGGSVIIQGVVLFDISGDIQIEPITSTIDFLRKMRSGRRYPLLQTTEGVKTQVNSQQLDELLMTKTEDEDINDLIQKIGALRSLSNQYPSFRVLPDYLKALKDHPGMRSLAAKNFDHSVVLNMFINQLR
jgi:hypothetical protein